MNLCTKSLKMWDRGRRYFAARMGQSEHLGRVDSPTPMPTSHNTFGVYDQAFMRMLEPMTIFNLGVLESLQLGTNVWKCATISGFPATTRSSSTLVA